MIRKTLTILSLIGLLLSVGCWGVSYCPIQFIRAGSNDYDEFLDITELGYGLLYRRFEFTSAGFFDGIGFHRVRDLRDYVTPLKPWIRISALTDRIAFGLPLWIPTLLFVSTLCVASWPLRRRRKRKKLGLCVKCGYDLRASQERCPECGTEFAKQE